MIEVTIDRVGSLLQIEREGTASYSEVPRGPITVHGPKGRQVIQEDDLSVTLCYPIEGGKLEIWDYSERLIFSTRLLKRSVQIERESPNLPTVTTAGNDASKSLKREPSREKYANRGSDDQDIGFNGSKSSLFPPDHLS